MSGSNWELDREYINDANSAICIIDYDDEGEPRRGFILKDHLGSTRIVVGDKVALPTISSDYLQLENVDSKVEIFWTGDYEPFGRPIETAEPLNPDHYENPIRYTGYYYDGDVFEHYYAMARYYDPYLGRFISRDPEGFNPSNLPSQANRYAYCINNPVMYNDPSGRVLGPLFALLGLGVDVVMWGLYADVLVNIGLGVWGTLNNPDVHWTEGFGAGMKTGVLSFFNSALAIGIANIDFSGWDFNMFDAFNLIDPNFGGAMRSALAQFNLFDAAVAGGYSWMLSANYAAAVTNDKALANVYRRNQNWAWKHHGWLGIFMAYGMTLYGNIPGWALSQLIFVDDFMQHGAHGWLKEWDTHSTFHDLYDNPIAYIAAFFGILL